MSNPSSSPDSTPSAAGAAAIPVKKRFIAGARCSQCQAMDRVMLCITRDDEWIECVDCGHTERRPTTVTPKGSFDASSAESTSNSDPVTVVQLRPMR